MREVREPLTVPTGAKVAVLSPAWAAPAYFPELHAQSMRRIEDRLGLEVVEYPTTRALGASPEQRAADVNAAFADPSIRAILTSIGGDDQIRVLPHLDPSLPQADPKPFFGYSDNTNILAWLFSHGVGAFHGGSTMVHLGPGPRPDPEHLASLRAALFGTGDLELTLPEDSEDFGLDFADPGALTEAAPREPAVPLEFFGPTAPVRGATWGGCLEVLDQWAWAGLLPPAADLEGAILIFETSEVLPAPDLVGRWMRGMGERGYLEAAAGLVLARPVVNIRESPLSPAERAQRRAAQRDYALAEISRYAPTLPVCVGLPFGHTKPQYVLPYGGQITLDPARATVTAHFGRG